MKAHEPTKVDHETHFTHPTSPRAISSDFPHQPEWQAYEQLKEKQLHNGRFMTLFYKTLALGQDDYPQQRNSRHAGRNLAPIWYPKL